MKRVKMFFISVLVIVCVLLSPNIVKAANSTATNWRLFCDSTVLTPSQTTDCYLIAQITDATDGGKPISAVLTSVSSTKAEIVNAQAAFSYIRVEKTLASAKFNNTLHGNKTNCESSGNCYDFISSTGIVSNNTDSKVNSKGFTGYTPIGYWTVKLNANQITSDADCGRICVALEYVVDGNSAVGNVVAGTNNANASCIELNLKQEANATCYCNSADNKCYGVNGTEVSRETYEAECNPKCGSGQLTEEEIKQYCTCTIEGGKYYGSEGTEVTEAQYKSECSKKCYQSNGKYYGKDGSEITKEQYEKDCIPKTGSFASYAVLAAGALIALSAITVAKKHNKFYRV